MARPTHPCRVDPEKLLADCTVRRQRRSGPGGQHRNKVETGVFLRHRPTGVGAAATERRSQAENKKEATRRLRVNLAIQHRCEVAELDQPHETWQAWCSGGRVVIGRNHQEFATLLAEAFDFVAAAKYDLAPAAERLGVSRSQLARLFRMEPAALQALNNRRREAGLPPLK